MRAYRRGLWQGMVIGILTCLVTTGFFMALVTSCQAQDIPEVVVEAEVPPEVEIIGEPSAGGRLQLKLDGRMGFWWPLEVAQKMAADLKIAKLRGLLVEDLELRKEIRDWQLDKLMAVAESGTLLIESLENAWLTAEDRAAESEAELNSPGRSRALWFAIGIAAGMVVVVIPTVAL